MPRPEPHPLAFFSLVPLNADASAVLKCPQNSHLISHIPEHRNVLGIEVGPHINSSSQYTLATLGRNGGADIVLEGASISRTQCSFEIQEAFGTVILFDRSHSQSTQVFGEKCMPLLPGQTRQVAVAENVNDILGMGGVERRNLLFQLIWHKRTETCKWKEIMKNRAENPRLARTVDDTPTAAPSERLTRIHTDAAIASDFRFQRLKRLGAGSFGEVWSAISAESAHLMAVKDVRIRTSGTPEAQWNLVKREIKILRRLSHVCPSPPSPIPPPDLPPQPHIVEYIGVRKLEEHVEIFMALKDGSVEDLIHQGVFKLKTANDSAEILFHHVLQGIDYLKNEKIVHRDLKPANILFTKEAGPKFRFQIADFGVSNFTDNATTFAGTIIFAAPEVQLGDGRPQTSKADIWSLFVTIAYALNIDGYRSKHLNTPQKAIQCAEDAAKKLPNLQDMVIRMPEKRASAAQLLLKHFEGKGLTTPLHKVDERSDEPDLNNTSSPAPKKSNAALRSSNQRK